MSGPGLLPGSGRRDNGAGRSQRLGRRAPTSDLLPRSCGATRTGRHRRLGPLRPRLAPCPQGLAWRVKRDQQGRGGAPRVWRVARRSSARRRTTRRNSSWAGSPGGIAGMEPGRSWCPCPPLSSDLLPTLHQPADPSTLASDLRTGGVALRSRSPAMACHSSLIQIHSAAIPSLMCGGKKQPGGRQEVQPRVLYKVRCTIAVHTALVWQERKGSRTGPRRIRLSFGTRGPGSPGAKGPGSTRESRNTHPLEPHGHVLLTERDADRLAFVESF